MLTTCTHWVEIDLLRGGEPMVVDARGQNVASHYRILVSRAEHRPRAVLLPFNVRHLIPSFRLPLQPGDDEPLVDVNHLLHLLYDRAGYDLRINYRAHADPSIEEADAVWAERSCVQQGCAEAISQNAYPSCAPSPLVGEGWDGGRGEERLSVPCAPLAPPPSPSPIKGEGIEEGESFPEIAQGRCLRLQMSPYQLTLTRLLLAAHEIVVSRRLAENVLDIFG